MGLKVCATPSTRELGEQVCSYLSRKMLEVQYGRYPDQEWTPRVMEPCVGDDVFVIGSTHTPETNFFDLGLTSLAVRRGGARRVVNVIPYLGYSRADWIDETEEGVFGIALGAKFAINVICQGNPDEVLLMDLHADQLEGFFPTEIFTRKLYAGCVSVPHLKARLELGSTVIAAPDPGSYKRTLAYAKYLGLDQTCVAVFTKARKKAGVVDPLTITVTGASLDGKDVWFVEDMVDTAGTMYYASSKAKEAGARAVYLYATHRVLSGGAIQKLEESPIVEFVTTNSIPKRPEELMARRLKITTLSLGSLIGEAIQLMYEQKPLKNLILSTKNK